MTKVRRILEKLGHSIAGRPEKIGDPYLLNAFASVFIGASTRRPGRFHILGNMVGVPLNGVIDNGLSILGVATLCNIVRSVSSLSSLFASAILKLRKAECVARQGMGNSASLVCTNNARFRLRDHRTLTTSGSPTEATQHKQRTLHPVDAYQLERRHQWPM